MTAYELRISDSSSDVCSSDLALGNDDTVLDELHQGAKTAPAVEHFKRTTRLLDRIYEQVLEYAARFDIGGQLRNFEKLFGARAYVDRRKRKLDRKRVGEGKGVEVGVDLGVRRIIKKKN